MKRVLLGAVMVALLLGAFAPSAQANTTSSTAPTTTAPSVAKGHRIKVYVNNHGSKVLRRTSTLWRAGKRVNDWTPRPGAYKVKSVITFRKRTTTEQSVWVPDLDCADYSYEGYNACAKGEFGYWDWHTTTSLGARRTVTRWNKTRVHADETPGCVSTPEFRAVKDGMTMRKVHSIFGTAGLVLHRGSSGIEREYATCSGDPDWSYVSVDYDWSRGAQRVWFKWQYISY